MIVFRKNKRGYQLFVPEYGGNPFFSMQAVLEHPEPSRTKVVEQRISEGAKGRIDRGIVRMESLYAHLVGTRNFAHLPSQHTRTSKCDESIFLSSGCTRSIRFSSFGSLGLNFWGLTQVYQNAHQRRCAVCIGGPLRYSTLSGP